MSKIRIIEPCFKHRFRVFLYPLGEDPRCSLMLMQQVVSFHYDLVKREAKLIVRDDSYGQAAGYLLSMTKTIRPPEIMVDVMHGNGDKVLLRRIFEGCEIVEHSSGFDYAESSFVAHVLTIRFRTIRFAETEEEQAPKPSSLDAPLV